MSDDDIYVVWSNEHRGWWKKGQFGYTDKLADAERYSRNGALNVCLGAMPARRDGCPLNEIPVRLDDMELLLQRFANSQPDDR